MADTHRTRSTSRSGPTTVSDMSTTRDVEHRDRSLIEEGAELGAAMLAVVQDNASAFFSEQRDRAADEIAALGELLHKSVRSMERREGVVARCTDETASQIDGFADWLRTRSARELAADVEDLARRYPLSFLSAATGMAFLAVRLLTASGDRTGTQPIDEQTQSRRMARAIGEPAPGMATGEAEVVAGVSGGAAAEHGAGTVGED